MAALAVCALATFYVGAFASVPVLAVVGAAGLWAVFASGKRADG